MTPLEIYEYKFTWLKGAHNAPFDESLEYSVKNWCRQNLEQKDWHFIAFTDMYEHSIAFRLEEDLKKFEEIFK